MSSSLIVESTRSGMVESVHRVSVAVVDEGGARVAWAGEPGGSVVWRSSAKPFLALPLVQDGAADRFGYGGAELALACGSHSSEPEHLEVCLRMLAASGCREEQLVCGPHPPLSAQVAERVLREGLEMTPCWSTCSGKHAAMLALARHHGWPLEGYEQAGHPVQQRLLRELLRWTGLESSQVRLGVDGCTALCFELPLEATALAYARLGASAEPAARRLREALWAHPSLVAGSGRLCTELMAAAPGGVLAKVGAEGFYNAALPELRLGVALKVEDGDLRCAPPALLAVLQQVWARLGRGPAPAWQGLGHHAQPRLLNTRGAVTGALRVSGELRLA